VLQGDDGDAVPDEKELEKEEGVIAFSDRNNEDVGGTDGEKQG
jgi:hypothetical protein